MNILFVTSRFYFILIVFTLVFHSGDLLCQNRPAIFENPNSKLRLGKYLSILEDTTGNLKVEKILSSNNFSTSTSDVPNLGVSKSSFWIKFQIQNATPETLLLLELSYPILDNVELYEVSDSANTILLGIQGDNKNFAEREFDHQNYIFEIQIPENSKRTYIMKVKAGEQILIPISIGTYKTIFSSTMKVDIAWGLYFGIIIVMFFYNLFIYFSVKDKVYLLYVVYIVLVGLTQGSLSGYTFKYLWPNSTWFANQSAIFFPSIVGIVLAIFLTAFMNTKKYVPKLHKGFYITSLLFIITIIISFSGNYNLGQTLVQPFAMVFSLYTLFVAAKISKMGYRPAKFFLLAWSIFLLGICIFVMKDFGVLPYNAFTNYTMTLGSAIEVVMLSLALADRINILKKEKEGAQRMELKERTEKQTILEKQTETLKIKVAEATQELKAKNKELEEAYKKLQEAQAELLQQEKMVSLGQMAAGVAHEINNPIHITNQAIDIIEASKDIYEGYIVKLEKILSEAENIDNQVLELNNYKKEIEFSEIAGEINNAIKRAKMGIERTATITKELKNFSKIDGEGWSAANINNDLEAMLDMLQSQISAVKVIKSYGKIPIIICNSQKLNQLYQNIFTNALEAIKAKDFPESQGLIEIQTYISDENLIISFSDNGIGMSEETLQKAFNPFFTTKGAQRKGLGLSNVYRTIHEHDGKVEIKSKIGVGTRIKLILPVGNLKKELG